MSSDRRSTLPPSQPSGILARLNTFNTKFLLVTGVSVVLGAVLNVMVARTGLQQLSDRSRAEVDQGLTPRSFPTGTPSKIVQQSSRFYMAVPGT